jgi:hypothetical protein
MTFDRTNVNEIKLGSSKDASKEKLFFVCASYASPKLLLIYMVSAFLSVG